MNSKNFINSATIIILIIISITVKTTTSDTTPYQCPVNWTNVYGFCVAGFTENSSILSNASALANYCAEKDSRSFFMQYVSGYVVCGFNYTQILMNPVSTAPVCYTVLQGTFTPYNFQTYDFNAKQQISAWIKFDANAANYLFQPNDPLGRTCATSWNLAYGTVRCGLFNSNQNDADRFVFRRAQSCLKFNSSSLTGVVNNCNETNLIEIAASTYDNGSFPWLNVGRLLKTFTNKIWVNKWYKYKLILYQTYTLYEIYDENSSFIERQNITHRNCGTNNWSGALQSLYFG